MAATVFPSNSVASNTFIIKMCFIISNPSSFMLESNLINFSFYSSWTCEQVIFFLFAKAFSIPEGLPICVKDWGQSFFNLFSSNKPELIKKLGLDIKFKT